MSKIKRPSIKELLFQLRNLEIWCEEYIIRNPRNWGEYAGLTDFYKPLRDGIVFYSSGWGWRLRKNWRETIDKKRADLQSEHDRFVAWLEAKYVIYSLDPKPGAEWKPTEERFLRHAIGCWFSPWPQHRLDERDEKITQEIERLLKTGDVFTHTSGDKYKVVVSQSNVQ